MIGSKGRLFIEMGVIMKIERDGEEVKREIIARKRIMVIDSV